MGGCGLGFRTVLAWLDRCDHKGEECGCLCVCTPGRRVCGSELRRWGRQLRLSPQRVSATWQQWPDSQRGYHHPTREAEVLSTRPGTKHNSVNTKARPWSFLVTLHKCTCGQRWVNLGQSGARRLCLFTPVERGTHRSHSSDAWAEAWRGRAQSCGSSVCRARFRHN